LHMRLFDKPTHPPRVSPQADALSLRIAANAYAADAASAASLPESSAFRRRSLLM
jgi:hypothetical protein